NFFRQDKSLRDHGADWRTTWQRQLLALLMRLEALNRRGQAPRPAGSGTTARQGRRTLRAASGHRQSGPPPTPPWPSGTLSRGLIRRGKDVTVSDEGVSDQPGSLTA